MAEFMGALDAVNALAERSPGFVWRLKDDSNNATNILVTDDPHFLVNMSVWETPEQLEHFVWNTVHKRIYHEEGQLVRADDDAAFRHVVDPGRPSCRRPQEALARLDHLTKHGPSDHAFGWESLPNVKLAMQQRCA